ncbi:hypothetical protein QQS45_02680 [Alteriqipengyuania flavescens]|uniref:hypothetical protein n=1 Tax=Alteriqipengyuania flavescens TaxID=3053610 RepID=UPI0025B475C3|nr:hypothetical protein [Alteriqipengyuania flavescens]WJY19159.1 hypothetical protein QQW98_02675 [Alteriqipengyuania flavescens]WJY25099.1 hypothetical protein QQS45_02680 [Alteriqipengyuania flavescens]
MSLSSIRPAGPLSPAYVIDQRPASRWSAGVWLLARDGSSAALSSLSPPYGGSQAGAVVRYRLGGSDNRPTAYARVNRSLARNAADSELALGLSARPLARVPVVAAVEGRVRDVRGGTDTRAAALAWTELPVQSLPLGLRAEAYLQGGYVTGRDATAFVDGQVRIDREVAALGGGRVRLRAGGGAWGGAQEGAARLDVGPGATMQLDLGQPAAQVALDWRFRVGGDAAPASGPAVTVTIGF